MKTEWFFFLDVDGTLAPIVRSPSQARIPQHTRNIIRELAGKTGCRVALVSGRPVRDLRRLLNVKGVILVGNHGFEFEGIPTPESAKKVVGYRHCIAQVVQKLHETFKNIKGVAVEDKIWTLSVHFRNMSSGKLPAFRRKLESIRRTENGKVLWWREGKKIWEARPPVAWDKGQAALYLLEKLGGYPIMMGDDRTDEDMFRVIAGKGLTVHVGYSRDTTAGFRLRSPRETGLLLEMLCRLRKQKNRLSLKLNSASRN